MFTSENLIHEIYSSGNKYNYQFDDRIFYNLDFVNGNQSFLVLDDRQFLLDKLNNGIFHSLDIRSNKVDILLVDTDNADLFTNYSTQLPFIGSQINIDSGSIINLYGLAPQYAFLSNSAHYYFDETNFEYIKYKSIESYYSGELIWSKDYCKHVNSIDLVNSGILFGGLPNNKEVYIESYSINNEFNCYINLFDSFATTYTNVYDVVSSSYFPTASSGYLNQQFDSDRYNNFSNIGFAGTIIIPYSIHNLNHLHFDAYQLSGTILFNYQFIQGYASGLIGFIPQGFAYASGTTVLEECRIPNHTDYQFTMDSLDIHYASSILNEGVLEIDVNDVAGLESTLSSLSPYGVVCFGNDLSDLYIFTLGNIDSTNRQNGLNCQSFEYNFSHLNLTVSKDKTKSTMISHGRMNNSGQLIWSDNHGPGLVRYAEYNGTGIITNLYSSPNHLGEIYSAQYNNSREKSLFTGNLVNGNTLGNYELRLFESGANIYDTGGNITGTYTNYIPTGQLLSNGISGTGIQTHFNKKSLSYAQSLTSNLTCGENVIYPSSLLYYTGVSPNFDVGAYDVHGTFIYISGVD